MEEDTLCRSCTAACCRSGVTMELNDTEVKFLTDAGANLEMINQGSKRGLLANISKRILSQDVVKDYVMIEDCVFLKENEETGVNECSIYSESSRPAICSRFKAGEYGCMLIRAINGIDPPEVFVEWKLRTQRY